MHQGMVGWKADILPKHWRSCTSPSLPHLGPVWRCWARSSRKSGTGQTGHGLTLMRAGMASPGLCRIQPGSRAAPGDSIQLLLNLVSVAAAGSDPAMGYLCLCDAGSQHPLLEGRAVQSQQCHGGAAGSIPPPLQHSTAMKGAMAAQEEHPTAPSTANPASKGNVMEQSPRR